MLISEDAEWACEKLPLRILGVAYGEDGFLLFSFFSRSPAA